jgi:ribbon-helix-helix CopG family protein
MTVRLPLSLIKELDEWAKSEGLSRNTLMSRELATAVTRRKSG